MLADSTVFAPYVEDVEVICSRSEPNNRGSGANAKQDLSLWYRAVSYGIVQGVCLPFRPHSPTPYCPLLHSTSQFS